MVMLVMVLMFLMIVAAAGAVLIVVMVMLVMVLMFLMIVAATGAVLIMVMMMFMIVVVMVFVLLFCGKTLHLQLGQFCCQAGFALHGLEQLLAGQVIPRRGDDGCHAVVLPEHGHCSVQLGLGNGIGTGQNNGGSGLHLVVVELAEVLHIHLDLACIGNRHGVAQGDLIVGHFVHRADDIGQLAHTGGLNENPVGVILLDDLLQSLAEIAHQRAADAAGVHLGNVDARILKETAVNADFAELIFNQHQLLSLVAFGNQLFNQRSLASAQKSGKNINFCHSNTF